MFWPIHAGGRYARTSSRSVSLSKRAPARARSISVSWLWTTPFGVPVVPDVKNIAATSSGLALATSAAKKPGCAAAYARPAAISASSDASPGSR
jgi:hypothetical protein